MARELQEGYRPGMGHTKVLYSNCSECGKSFLRSDDELRTPLRTPELRRKAFERHVCETQGGT